MWPFTLSSRLPIVALVSRYLTNKLIGRGPVLKRSKPLTASPYDNVVLCGITTSFPELFLTLGLVIHVLLTRLPLEHPRRGLSVRLACLKRAASVRSEPGSDSP